CARDDGSGWVYFDW
nr:immunoglobulin heavy chain junction region [Macaca mulatta]